ncbi:hypothetical protein PRIPAC_96726 [Pristionchus pacificus]|uniref:Uncharacterized protein n=1 Tax=Pristionchus pacificus TaxID=54126 RepID=A0A2A6CU98_PRIPA|nr:hypothetical protein PRIPAC_96726 [Pristionchus pacificus]|eukprot:PDM81627.1 hypothetical protein PRIPAC_30608 [Pristionchus pacificus]
MTITMVAISHQKRAGEGHESKLVGPTTTCLHPAVTTLATDAPSISCVEKRGGGAEVVVAADALQAIIASSSWPPGYDKCWGANKSSMDERGTVKKDTIRDEEEAE